MLNILLSSCSDYALAQYLHIIRKILGLIQLFGPMITILVLAIRFALAMIGVDEKNKNNIKIFNSILAMILLFFVPMIINVSILLLSKTGVSDISDFPSCWVEAEDIYKTFEDINYDDYKTATKKQQKENKNVPSGAIKSVDINKYFAKSNKKLTKISENATNTIKNKSKNSNDSSDAEIIVNGKKHNLTNSELRYLAAVCTREQGSIPGIRAEANLIANRYELYDSNNYSSVYNYVKNTRWFSSKRSLPTPSKAAINTVRSVLVQGNRTIPLYVDEHDCMFCYRPHVCANGNIGDICSISGGTSKSYITNRKNFKRDKTVINNYYKSRYTFYYFPTSTSDPFGYTSTAYRKIKSMNK